MKDFERILKGFRMIWEDLVGFERIWKDLVGFGRIWKDLGGFSRFSDNFSQPASPQPIEFYCILLISLILLVSPPAVPTGWLERRRSKIHQFPTKNWWELHEKYKKVNKTTRNSSKTLHTTILKWLELVGTLLATALAVVG